MAWPQSHLHGTRDKGIAACPHSLCWVLFYGQQHGGGQRGPFLALGVTVAMGTSTSIHPVL